MLGQLSEKKSLIYFASGLRLNGVEQPGATARDHQRGHSRRGLVLADRRARSQWRRRRWATPARDRRAGSACIPARRRMAAMNNFQRRRTRFGRWRPIPEAKRCSISTILPRGSSRRRRAFSSYYIIGYYTTNANLDGKFRRIKISLQRGRRGQPRLPPGLLRRQRVRQIHAADKERQLEDALMLGDPITELTIAMEVDYFQLNRAEYFVPVVVKIPGSELALAKKGGAEHTLIDFIGEIKDEYGTTVSNVRDKVDIKLSGRDGRGAGEASHRVRYRLYAAAREIHHQVSGPRRRNGPDRNVPDHVHDSQPE